MVWDPHPAIQLKLRYFTGLTVEQAAQTLIIFPSTAARPWDYARAWLYAEIRSNQESSLSD